MALELHKFEIPTPARRSRADHRRDSLLHSLTDDANGSRPRDRRIQVVLALLEQNSHQPVNIAEIARLVNLSPGRLAHLFKNETGIAIQQHLTQIRLAKAKHQLESSFLAIKEIAASVGFPSVTRFVACFKSAVGVTPAQYRKLATIEHARRKDLVLARSANR